MCGRFTNTLSPEELTKQIGEQFRVQFRETVSTDPWNIRPTDEVPTIVGTSGFAEPRMLRWGLVPPWDETPNSRRPLINARVEGLVEKGAYSGIPFGQLHRALVLADGFYEWEHPEDKKVKGQPYRFTVDAGGLFAFAAVWSTNHKIQGGPIHSCSIVTCDSASNPLVAKVHNRMPVILTEDEEMWAWISPDIAAPDALSLCRPLDAGRMVVEAREPGSGQPANGQLSLPS